MCAAAALQRIEMPVTRIDLLFWRNFFYSQTHSTNSNLRTQIFANQNFCIYLLAKNVKLVQETKIMSKSIRFHQCWQKWCNFMKNMNILLLLLTKKGIFRMEEHKTSKNANWIGWMEAFVAFMWKFNAFTLITLIALFIDSRCFC